MGSTITLRPGSGVELRSPCCGHRVADAPQPGDKSRAYRRDCPSCGERYRVRLTQVGANVVRRAWREHVDSAAEAMVDGVKPRRGLWLCSPSRGIAYGRILSVRSDGVVRWWSQQFEAHVDTGAHTIHAGDYRYLAGDGRAPPAGYEVPS